MFMTGVLCTVCGAQVYLNKVTEKLKPKKHFDYSFCWFFFLVFLLGMGLFEGYLVLYVRLVLQILILKNFVNTNFTDITYSNVAQVNQIKKNTI